MQRVSAVVVTFNKLGFLKNAVAALKSQTYPLAEIVVVDNASTDGTREWLAEQHGLRVLTLPVNSGGAGGFYAGMKDVHDRRPDWIWLMDDDTEPVPSSLEMLMQEAERRPMAGFFNSFVMWDDDRPCRMNIPPAVWEWTEELEESKRKVVRITACSFVSCLVNGAFVASVGFPVKDFFIWFDDFEYTDRLGKRAPGYLVLDSKVYHRTKENQAVNWALVNDSNYWRYALGIRNEFSWILRGDGSWWKRFFRAIARFLEIHEFLAHGKVRRLIRAKLSWKAFRGAFWNYRRCIERPSPAEGETSLTFDRAVVSHHRYPGQSWDAVYGNEALLQIHPGAPAPVPDEPITLTFAGVKVTPSSFFWSRIHLQDAKAKSVDFAVEVLEDGRCVHTEVGCVRKGGDHGVLTFPFSFLSKETNVTLRLYTRMTHGEPDNFYCSAFWLTPRVGLSGGDPSSTAWSTDLKVAAA